MSKFYHVVYIAEEQKYFWWLIYGNSLDSQNCLYIVCCNCVELQTQSEDQGANKSVCHNGSGDTWHRMT